jgi:hypothetical protein
MAGIPVIPVAFGGNGVNRSSIAGMPVRRCRAIGMLHPAPRTQQRSNSRQHKGDLARMWIKLAG